MTLGRPGLITWSLDLNQPLMTHGLVDEVWIPPRDPFVTYEASDESWARYCGLGRVVKRLKKLYDVRDEKGDLVGYTSYNPSDTRGHRLEIPIANRAAVRFYQTEPIQRDEIKTVEVELAYFRIDSETFCTWRCRLVDAEPLVRCGWIKCVGEDNKERFIDNIREKLYNRIYGR